MNDVNESSRELEDLCEFFRKTAMIVWRDEANCVKMSLPYYFSDACTAIVKIKLLPDGKLRVSDDGRIARHEFLTPTDIHVVCRKWCLEYQMNGDSENLPLECEMYTVVEKTHFGEAVWKIIDAIMDAREITGR